MLTELTNVVDMLKLSLVSLAAALHYRRQRALGTPNGYSNDLPSF